MVAIRRARGDHCLLTGFYFLRVHDVRTATFFAVALNVAVAGIAFFLSRVTAHQAAEVAAGAVEAPPPPGGGLVYATIALSGMTALGAEVVWTRLFTLLLGGTTYTFSIILAVFLIGIGLGSSAGSWISRKVARPREALGTGAAAACWRRLRCGLRGTSRSSLPYWPVNSELGVRSRLSARRWISFRCAWAILPAASLWGASCPLALAAVASGGQDGARLVGRVYAANPVGAIVGALMASLVIIAWLGTQQADRILIVLSAISGALMLLPRFVQGARMPVLGSRAAVWAAAAAIVAALLVRGVEGPPRSPLLAGYG